MAIRKMYSCPRITYTEPLSKRAILNSTLLKNDSELLRQTYEGGGASGKYDNPMDSLSNDYGFNVLTNSAV
jgi:hypothetical protein